MLKEISTTEFTRDKNVYRIGGSLKRGGSKRLQSQIRAMIRSSKDSEITFDLEKVTAIDSAGASVLLDAIAELKRKNVIVNIIGASPSAKGLLERYEAAPISIPQSEQESFLYRVGQGVVNTWYSFVEVLILISESFYWSAVGIFNRKGHRKGAVAAQALSIGVGALPVVALISFLIGIVMALQSAAQLKQFGANIFVADLVVIAMAREMGPLMTAIILAGRSGASIAAEVSSMTVSEEIDALKTMAANPIRYIVVPKLLGITITMPLLSVISTVLGIFGGYLIAINVLDLSTPGFLNQAVNALYLKDLMTGLAKSIVFSWLIVVIASHYGFKVSGGPEGVGKATTKAVVASIFAVIVADAFLGLLFYL